MSSLTTATAFTAELRQATLRLFRSPSFAALAIGTLAVGIGISTGMFVLMDALLFRAPFQIAQPEELVKGKRQSNPSVPTPGLVMQ